jgi:HB1, ASXL, restriction endonuclease HTH domain
MAAKKKTNPAPKTTAKGARRAASAAAKGAGRKAEPAAKAKKVSALDAAARVLQEEKKAMNCQEMIEMMAAKDYWKSPGGKTPAATLYSAILRETKVKGAGARFKKTERGKFQFKGR